MWTMHQDGNLYAAATRTVAARTAEAAVATQTKPERPRAAVLHMPCTLTVSIEEHWPHFGALYGLDPGHDEILRGLGGICDCLCRQRTFGDAGGFCGRNLRASGSPAFAVVGNDGFVGIGAGERPALY